MRSSSARAWSAYNLGKQRRFMERTAQLAAVERVCEDCGGKGVDPGSLDEAEPCKVCDGSGVMRAAERAERKEPGRATAALSKERA